MTDRRWIVAGLANPEAEYGGTRHNLGADVVRLLAARLGADFKPHKAGAQCADTFDRPGGTPLTLMIPFGYMNNSGGPVQQVTAFYKVDADHLVVVHDELDLDLALVRLKRGGGTAGHNGLRDIERRLGTRDFYRVRVGVGRPPGRRDPADHLLRRFTTAEREDIDIAAEHAADAVLELVTNGLETAQNRHHGRA